MKKILITGFNNEQTTYDGYLNKRIGVILCHYGLIKCLEDLKFEVTQKPTPPRTDLSEYDHVIVFIHNPQGFSQKLFLYGIFLHNLCLLSLLGLKLLI